MEQVGLGYFLLNMQDLLNEFVNTNKYLTILMYFSSVLTDQDMHFPNE